ncbi:hypothetical protein D3C78_1011940 [compost metagenome]
MPDLRFVAARQATDQRRRPQAPGPAAQRATGHGRLPWLAVRLLHPRLRHVAVRPAEEQQRPRPAPGPGSPGRQPVPLHRLPADPRRRRAELPPALPRPVRCPAGTDHQPPQGHCADPDRRTEQRRQALPGAADRGRPGRPVQLAPRGAAAGRRYRPGPGSHPVPQDLAGDDLRRPCGRAQAHRENRQPPGNRRRNPAHRLLRRAERGIPGLRRPAAPLRLAADPQPGHPGRQYRQRFANRRLATPADCPGRADRPAPGRASAGDAAGRLFHRLPHHCPPGQRVHREDHRAARHQRLGVPRL